MSLRRKDERFKSISNVLPIVLNDNIKYDLLKDAKIADFSIFSLDPFKIKKKKITFNNEKPIYMFLKDVFKNDINRVKNVYMTYFFKTFIFLGDIHTTENEEEVDKKQVHFFNIIVNFLLSSTGFNIKILVEAPEHSRNFNVISTLCEQFSNLNNRISCINVDVRLENENEQQGCKEIFRLWSRTNNIDDYVLIIESLFDIYEFKREIGKKVLYDIKNGNYNYKDFLKSVEHHFLNHQTSCIYKELYTDDINKMSFLYFIIKEMLEKIYTECYKFYWYILNMDKNNEDEYFNIHNIKDIIISLYQDIYTFMHMFDSGDEIVLVSYGHTHIKNLKHYLQNIGYSKHHEISYSEEQIYKAFADLESDDIDFMDIDPNMEIEEFVDNFELDSDIELDKK